MNAHHATDTTTQTAVGAVEAQQVIDDIRDGVLPADAAFLRYVELVAKFGKSSPACASYIVEAFKRAAA